MAAEPAFPARAPGAVPRPAAGRAWVWGTASLTAGTVVAVAALAPPATAPPGRALSWLLFTGSSVHVAATGWLFTVPDVRARAARHRLRYLGVPAALAALAAATAALLPPATFRWLLLPYFGWQFFHYQKQNLGLAALAAAASRVPPLRAGERRALLLAGLAGVAALLSRPWLLGLPLGRPGTAGRHPAVLHPAVLHPARLPLSGLAPGPGLAAGPGLVLHVVFPVTAALFAAAVLAGMATLIRRPGAARPPGFATMYLAALLFGVPVFVFSSPYAAIGGMTAAHGLQYLLLVALVAAGTGGGPPRLLRLALLANIAVAGGAALSAASHLHSAGPAGRLLFGAYLGAVMAHFAVDAGLWRLRDPAARQVIAARVPYLLPARTAAGRPPAASAGQSSGRAGESGSR